MSFSSKEDPKTLVLFDVDGTLTPARLTVSDEMKSTLEKLRKRLLLDLLVVPIYPNKLNNWVQLFYKISTTVSVKMV